MMQRLSPSDGARVLVVGGGLVGAASALRLQDAGASVVLVDPGDEQGRASFGNATLIANELAEPLSNWSTLRNAPSQLFAFDGPLDFVLEDVGLWAPWAVRYLAACRRVRRQVGREALEALMAQAAPAWRRLGADLGAPGVLEGAEHWALWEDASSMPGGIRSNHEGSSRAVTVRDLERSEVEPLRRAVSARLLGGVAFGGSDKVRDPGDVVRRLHSTLEARGAEIVLGRVAALRPRDDGVTADMEGGRVLTADLALVAAGARSAPLVRGWGLHAPLVAERGYHLQYAEHDVPASVPPLVLEDRFICVVHVGAAVRITGMTEIGSPDSPPDPRKWSRLQAHVAALGLPVRGEPSRWMGSRPTLPDFVPAIGRCGRLLYAFGHQHVGVTLAAVTAEWIAQLAEAGETPEELRPYALERFRRR